MNGNVWGSYDEVLLFVGISSQRDISFKIFLLVKL